MWLLFISTDLVYRYQKHLDSCTHGKWRGEQKNFVNYKCYSFITIANCWQSLLELFSTKFHANLFISSRVDGQRVTAEVGITLQIVVKKKTRKQCEVKVVSVHYEGMRNSAGIIPHSKPWYYVFYLFLLAIRKNTVYKLMWYLYKHFTIPCITTTWYGIHPAMSPQVLCKSRGQHLFNFLVFIGCSSGSNRDWDWLPGCWDLY